MKKLIKNPYLSYMIWILFLIFLWDLKAGANRSNEIPFTLFPFLLCAIFIPFLSIKKTYDIITIHLLSFIIIYILGIIHKPFSIFDNSLDVLFPNVFYLIVFIVCSLALWSLMNKKISSKILHISLILSIITSFLIIYISINPGIDVYNYLNQSYEKFLHGENPYLFQYLYKHIAGQVSNLDDTSSLIYWPINIEFGALFHYFSIDYRYFSVIANSLISFLIINKNCLAISTIKQRILIAIIWCISPFTLLVSEKGWVDLYAPIFIFLLVFTLSRYQKITCIILAILVSIKLYNILMVPFVFIFIVRMNNRILLLNCILIFLITLLIPFTFFYQDVFFVLKTTLQPILSSSIRLDSISFISLLFKMKVPYTGFISLSFLPIYLLLLFSFYKNTKFHLLIKYLIFSFLILFLTAKQSFFNYYYLVYILSFIYYFKFKDDSIESF